MKYAAYLFLLLACITLLHASNLIWKHLNPFQLTFSTPPTVSASVDTTKVPTLLIIESIHISLPIYPAIITKNTWETTDKGVSYATSTPIPGESGNSIIYGHNFSNILGKLPRVTPGEKIIITFSDNSSKTFIVDSSATVEPTAVEVLKSTSMPVLTIYTCAGFLDSKRFVIRAIPESSV